MFIGGLGFKAIIANVTPPPEAESRELNETDNREHMITIEPEWHSIQEIILYIIQFKSLDQ
jgi:hypothetical protein